VSPSPAVLPRSTAFLLKPGAYRASCFAYLNAPSCAGLSRRGPSRPRQFHSSFWGRKDVAPTPKPRDVLDRTAFSVFVEEHGGDPLTESIRLISNDSVAGFAHNGNLLRVTYAVGNFRYCLVTLGNRCG
jgi:hypothetical protein